MDETMQLIAEPGAKTILRESLERLDDLLMSMLKGANR